MPADDVVLTELFQEPQRRGHSRRPPECVLRGKHRSEPRAVAGERSDDRGGDGKGQEGEGGAL
jgi:hypothetical protein